MTRLIPDWGIRITNFGLGYILMCLVVAIAATNTGNNGNNISLATSLIRLATPRTLTFRGSVVTPVLVGPSVAIGGIL